MNFFILIGLTTIFLNANGLESFLAKEEPKNEEQKENHQYFLIKHKKAPIKIKENNTPNTNEKFDPNPQFGEGYYNTQANETLNNFKSEFYRSNQELEELKKNKEKKSARQLEEKIYINFNLPYRYIKHGIKEDVTISFDIDENKNISNIQFIQQSSYEDINNAFKEAIIKSSLEFEAPKQKETKTVYYRFDI